MLEDGEESWRGMAYDVESAEEKCFYDEEPASLVKYTLQKWGRVKLTKEISDDGWITVYENERLK